MAAAKTEIPEGRRPLARDEVLFVYAGRPLCGRHHTWLSHDLGADGVVVACGVCGRIKRDQTMPARREPIL